MMAERVDHATQPPAVLVGHRHHLCRARGDGASLRRGRILDQWAKTLESQLEAVS